MEKADTFRTLWAISNVEQPTQNLSKGCKLIACYLVCLLVLIVIVSHLELVGATHSGLAGVASLRDGRIVVIRGHIKLLPITARPEAKTGAPMRHIQAHATCVAPIGKYIPQGRGYSFS